ncbi:MAG: glutamine--fructose-6-phosphate transaminase (isomerizing) [Oscillospiraceae bacterium]|nr:glutamine--fructose-6-phosphate transaminase (isomerizing) [Oscillospiraceae bacterium]
MCGIVGYTGDKRAAPFLLGGLEKLEYRGYDSAGVALSEEGNFQLLRRAGRVTQLKTPLEKLNSAAVTGIAHTRWATHGPPTEENAHPHLSEKKQWVVVHNGIIENAEELRRELADVKFKSETDTEVIPHLLEKQGEINPVEALVNTQKRLEGAWALGILCAAMPDTLFCACKGSPLLVGVGAGGTYLASDYAAFDEDVTTTYRLCDGEIGVLTKNTVCFYNCDGDIIDKSGEKFSWKEQRIDKGDYEHFMRSEIDQQPLALRQTLAQFFTDGAFSLSCELPEKPRKIWLIACGSAYHACVTGKYVIEELAKIPCETAVASEFRYCYPLIGDSDLAVFVSQSGETADTLAAVREANANGAVSVGIVNVPGSAIARECRIILPTKAGTEVAVATTKAYCAQLAVLYSLALHYVTDSKQKNAFQQALRRLPEDVQQVLDTTEKPAMDMAREIYEAEHAYFIGRNLDFSTVLEGSLKLKEISYLHSEAYPAGELKHGTISLVEEGTPVIALACCERLLPKTLANIREVMARGAAVFAVTTLDDIEDARGVITIRKTHPLVMPSLAVVPLQLLSYHVARLRGCDIDKPRNLAKSVTVE